MRRIFLILFWLSLSGTSLLPAQTVVAAPEPQSARQALIEMCMGKGVDAFEKHLPDVARQTLLRKNDAPQTSIVLKISSVCRQITGSAEHFETFDEGPNILVTEQNGGREKVEVAVEHDSLMGEQDEIELSIHYYKDAQPQALPVVPGVTFTFRQEKDIWRLVELTAAAHVPLTDPDYLKGLRKQQNELTEGTAQMRLGVIAGAETTYAGKHPDRGYTCALTTLFARDPAAAPGDGGYTDPGEAGEEWNGYRFSVTGCDGSPAGKFRVSAVPTDTDSGLKTFCTDETGTMKFVELGKGSACFTRGQPVNPGAPAAFSED